MSRGLATVPLRPTPNHHRLGATHLGDGRSRFVVWAPEVPRLEVLLEDGREIELVEAGHPWGGRGVLEAEADGVAPGTRYQLRLHLDDGPVERPDPASRHQPDGVHGPSAVVDDGFDWTDGSWSGLPLEQLVIYELHVGTFTEGGTFASAIERLDELADLGVTAIEVMPIAQFPGGRNWGYDGVLPSAAQSTYGGPDGFRRLVDACHRRGLAVILDVVYNHFGPEGTYQPEFGPYWTDRYETPWGPALNFDGPGSDGVRRYFIESALWWIEGCHVDGLRLDAVHAILDQSAYHFLRELADVVHARAQRSNRRVHLIAETDLNDPRLIRSAALGGYELDAQWIDDFHHALHAAVTGEQGGYYADYGSMNDLAVALQDGYVLQGQLSTYRGHRHGVPPDGVCADQLVVCAQNHDQVGNRRNGERLGELVDRRALLPVAAITLLAPFVPMLFMGEEYGETAPFLYFVSHTDADLVEAVREGRREEFAAFMWADEAPDPQSEETFTRSQLRHDRKGETPHAQILAWHRRLLELRRNEPALASLDRDRVAVRADEVTRTLAWRRWTDGGDEVVGAVRLSGSEVDDASWSLPAGRWTKLLDSAEAVFGGSGDVAADSVRSESATEVTLPAYGAHVYRREAGG